MTSHWARVGDFLMYAGPASATSQVVVDYVCRMLNGVDLAELPAQQLTEARDQLALFSEEPPVAVEKPAFPLPTCFATSVRAV